MTTTKSTSLSEQLDERMTGTDNDRKSHVVDMRKKSLFRMVDNDGSGQIDENEFGDLYDVIRRETERDVEDKAKAERAATAYKRKVKLFGCFGLTMALFLGLSVASNFVVTFALLEATKETEAKDGVLKIKNSDKTVAVASADTDVDSTGKLLIKNSSVPVRTESSDMTVNSDSALVARDGTPLQMDVARHWKEGLSSTDVVDQLLSNEDTRHKLNSMTMKNGEDSKLTFEIKAYDTATIRLAANGGALAATLSSTYDYLATVALFYTTHPFYPAFAAARVTPTSGAVQSAAFLVNASILDEYRCITSLASACTGVDWEARLPIQSGSRRELFGGFGGFGGGFGGFGGFGGGMFSMGFSSNPFTTVGGTFFANTNFGSLIGNTGSFYNLLTSFPAPIYSPGRRASDSRRALATSMYAAVYDWSGRADIANGWCSCWTSAWVSGDTSVDSSEWNEAKSTKDAATENSVSVNQGDGMKQYLEYVDGTNGRRLKEILDDYSREHNGRLLSEALAEDPKSPHLEPYNRRLLSGCPGRNGRSCHPAHATVELASGAHVRLDTLSVGDAIRTPSGFEPVVGFLHADKDTPTLYHVFTTEHGRKMAISDKHFLFADGVETDPATVKIGQVVSTPEGPQAVIAIVKETHVGAFHLVTPSGAYFVDGIAASTYVSYIPLAAWKVFGDGYISLRYKLGLPIVPEGDAPITLFWFLDALTTVGVPDALQSALFWPLIAGSVVATELASAVGMAAAKMLPASALTAAVVAAPFAIKMAAK